ncbi:MAG: dTDP-4-dehydrorhamnose 3,5-epimerase [Desulfovibrionaceae bacterium]|nr:dTDP-4-dehydrorhamnose 3,5-epimerase [Desulfovibrionaceae bacterium]
MQIIKTDFPELLIFEPAVHRDARGFFLETFREEHFARLGIDFHCVQANQSFSAECGVLRGLHFQKPPKAQAKLVWVTRGEVLDVVVDMRPDSPTWGRHFSLRLSEANFRRLFVPKGFAHGYLTLTPETEFNYMVDAYYAPDHEGGVLWNDPELGIDWPLEQISATAPILSEKDKKLPLFSELKNVFQTPGQI